MLLLTLLMAGAAAAVPVEASARLPSAVWTRWAPALTAYAGQPASGWSPPGLWLEDALSRRSEALAPLLRALEGQAHPARSSRTLEPGPFQAALAEAVAQAQSRAAALAAEAGRELPQGAEGLRAALGQLDAAASFAQDSLQLFGGEALEKAGVALERRRSQAGSRLAEARFAQAARALDSAFSAAAPLDDEALRAFIEERHAEVRRRRPDLFLAKMRKAAASDFAFFRGMPELFYETLARGDHAEAARRSPAVLLVGDIHGENVEIVDGEQARPTPQFNDFDDAARGPAALDMARLLAGAALLGDGSRASYAQLAEAARQGYLEGLEKPFAAWSREAAGEDAVRRSRAVDKDWRRRGGRPLDDSALEARLFSLAGLNPKTWLALDRAGAGLSSIGVRRYLFAHRKKSHARELKELRQAAAVMFTGRPEASQAPRVEQAYARLRQVRVEASVVIGEAGEWLLRRRQGAARALALGHELSAARVLGGLAAQQHRGQADPRLLAAALAALSLPAALGLAAAMAGMRSGLRRILDSGAWERRGGS